MRQTPSNIVEARVLDLDSGQEQALTTRPGSYCHFIDRFTCDGWDIQLRVDWKDLDTAGDPTLDADFYRPGERRLVKGMKQHQSHHTQRSRGSESQQLVYDFGFGSLRMRLVLTVTREKAFTVDGFIVEN